MYLFSVMKSVTMLLMYGIKLKTGLVYYKYNKLEI